MTISKIDITILSAVFASALLIGASSIAGVVSAQNYDAGEEYKGFTFDHDDADADDAKGACSDSENAEECEECIDKREELQGLKGYEAVKCLKDPNSY
jgi:hypothetical protein